MKNVKIEFGITNNSRNEHQHKGKISSNNSSYSPLLSKPIFPNINQSKGDGTGRKKKLFNSASSVMLFPKKKLQSNFVKLTPDSNKYTKNDKYIHNKKMLLETFRLTHSKIINSDNKLDLYKKAMSIQRKPSKKPKVLLVQNKKEIQSILQNSLIKENDIIPQVSNESTQINMSHSLIDNKPIPSLLCRKEIDHIPVLAQMPETHNNLYSSWSEKSRYLKVLESLLKLKSMINLDSRNAFKYLKQYLYSNGITDMDLYSNLYLVNFSNYLHTDFCRTIDPNKNIKEILMDALILGKQQYNDSERTKYISPYLKIKNIIRKDNRYQEKKLDRYDILKLERQRRMYEEKKVGNSIEDIKEKLEDELHEITPYGDSNPFLMERNNNVCNNFYITLEDNKKEVHQLEPSQNSTMMNFEVIKKNKKITEYANLERIKQKIKSPESIV